MSATAGPPPPDYLANERNTDGLVAASVVMFLIATLFVGLRFYTRAYVVRTLGPSDWIIFTSLVFSLANSIGTLEQVRLGSIGRHSWTIPGEVFVAGMKLVYFVNLSYIISLVSIKLSILVLYLRILSPVLLHRLCYAAIVFVFGLGCYSLISNAIPCLPVAAFWDGLLLHPDAWCWPQPAKWWSDITIHLVGEVIILLLPMPFLLGLSIPLKRKIGVILLFAFGTIVILVSALRIPSIVAINTSLDPSWDAANIAVWSAIELNTAIVCACCMTLKPLFGRIFPRLFSRAYQQQGSVDDSRGHRLAHGQHAHDDLAHPRDGDHPLTIGTRRERPLPRHLTLDTIDLPQISPIMSSKGSAGVLTDGSLSPLPTSPQRQTSPV